MWRWQFEGMGETPLGGGERIVGFEFQDVAIGLFALRPIFGIGGVEIGTELVFLALRVDLGDHFAKVLTDGFLPRKACTGDEGRSNKRDSNDVLIHPTLPPVQI